MDLDGEGWGVDEPVPDVRCLLSLRLRKSTPANSHLVGLGIAKGRWDSRRPSGDDVTSGELRRTDEPGVALGVTVGDNFRRFNGLSGVFEGRSCETRLDGPAANRLARIASVGELGR